MSRYAENLAWGSLGAGLAYLLTRRYLVQRFQRELDVHVAEITNTCDEFYRLKYEKKLKAEREKDLSKTPETIGILVEESPVNEEPVIVPAKQPETVISEAGLTDTMTNYRGMFNPSTPKEYVQVETVNHPEPEPEEPAEAPVQSKNPRNLPVMISQEAYMENHSGYKQLARIYYAGDSTLADEENNIIADEGLMTLGQEVVEKLRMGLDGDAEVIYVRNKALETEYEIFREPHLYTEAVGPKG